MLITLPSLLLTLIIHQAARLTAPKIIDVQSIGPGYAKVLWTPPEVTGNKLTGYFILVTLDKRQQDRKWNKVRLDGVANQGVLSRLKDNVQYFIKVKPIFDNTEFGQASDVYQFEMSKPKVIGGNFITARITSV